MVLRVAIVEPILETTDVCSDLRLKLQPQLDVLNHILVESKIYYLLNPKRIVTKIPSCKLLLGIFAI